MSEITVGINEPPRPHEPQPSTAMVQHGLAWGSWLQGATISIASWNHDPSITVTDLGLIGDTHYGLVSGGDIGVTYTIESDITTTSLERRRKAFLLEILDEPAQLP